MSKYVSVIYILTQLCLSCDYSNDSLSTIYDCNFIERNFIKVINNWQKLSYSTNALNCQFYPSCSNYCSLAIAKKGVVKGMVIGLDRIIRCNPAAIGYHFQQSDPKFYYDGRLIDNLEFNKSKIKKKWIVYMSVIPGMGRAYLGHKLDGFVSLAFVSFFSGISYNSFNNNNNTIGIISGILSALLWTSDYYGTYRTLALNQNNN